MNDRPLKNSETPLNSLDFSISCFRMINRNDKFVGLLQ